MKKLKILGILGILMVVISMFSVVNADTGPKPTINIEFKNLPDGLLVSDLEVGLLTSCTDRENNTNPEDIKDFVLDNWEYDDDRLLWKSQHETSCSFTYFGVPTVYRIIVHVPGEEGYKVSDIIERKELIQNITLDLETMEVQGAITLESVVPTVVEGIICIALTLIIELLIAKCFRIKETKVLVITNICTQLALQILLNVGIKYIIALTIGEILVFLTEFFVYKKYIKSVESTKKIFGYTLVANVASCLIGIVTVICVAVVMLALA